MGIESYLRKVIKWGMTLFFVSCGIVICRWAILRFVCWAGWGTPDWAAWVQAVGSVVAILAAIWIANSQAKREENIRAKARREAEIEKRYRDHQLDLSFAQQVVTLAQDLSMMAMHIQHNVKLHRSTMAYKYPSLEIENILARIAEVERQDKHWFRLMWVGQMRSYVLSVYSFLANIDATLEVYGPQYEAEFLLKLEQEGGSFYDKAQEHYLHFAEHVPPSS